MPSSSLVAVLNPQHYEQTANKGSVFLYTTAAKALLLSDPTGNVPTVINPPNSGVDFVPLVIKASFVSGTTVIGGVLISRTLNATAAATGAAIITATLVAPVNAYAAGNVAKGSSCLWSPNINTFTAAPVTLAASSISFGAVDPTAAGADRTDRLDGSLVFGPGSAMSLTYSVVSSVSLWFWTIIGVEIPVN
jgi:hypothetical protein